MRVEVTCSRCARRAGGLVVGLTINFPVSVVTAVKLGEIDAHEDCIGISFGLIAWRLRFDLFYNRRTEILRR